MSTAGEAAGSAGAPDVLEAPDASEGVPDGVSEAPGVSEGEPDGVSEGSEAPGVSGVEPEAPDAVAGEEPGRGRRGVRWTRRRAAAVAGLVAALLLSGGLLYAAQDLKDPAASGNHALTDTAATDQVTGEVSSALSRIFAYTPDSAQATAQAAHDLLGGTAATQYQTLFAQVRGQVAAQRLTLTTRVVRAGVVTLTAHRARLLVFLDQTAQRAGGAAASAAAQLAVTAELDGGHWRITELTAR